MAKKQKKEKKRWIDAALVRQAVKVGGIQGLALTKLDVLDGMPELRIGVGYRIQDEMLKAATVDLLIARTICSGKYLIVIGGLLGWCSLRALLHKPTRRARLRHYPETE